MHMRQWHTSQGRSGSASKERNELFQQVLIQLNNSFLERFDLVILQVRPGLIAISGVTQGSAVRIIEFKEPL